MRFFIGKIAENEGKALMQYKFRETDSYWVPYTSDGIRCFSSCAPDTVAGLLKHPGIRAPKRWPESVALRSFLTECPEFSEAEHTEWEQFFGSVPTVVDEYKEEQLFPWTLPGLVETFKATYMGTTTSGEDLGDLGRPEMPDERVLHPLFTATDAKKEARARATNYHRQQEALKAQKECEQQSQTQTQRTSRASRSRAPAESEDDTSPDETKPDREHGLEPGLPLKGSGVIRVGDIVVISPTDESRESDIRNGFKLGLNIGNVCDINFKTKQVELWWYYSSQEQWSSNMTFIPWRHKKTHAKYKDWLDAKVLIHDDISGAPVKLDLVKFKGREGFAQYKLSKKSFETILEVVRADEEFCEKNKK